MSQPMTDAQVLAAIRADHLKANIVEHEENQLVGEGQYATVHWERAHLDGGGTVFGPGPYAHVPVTLEFNPPVVLGGKAYTRDEITVRVYPPARLRRKLASRWKPAPSTPGDPSVPGVSR